MRSGGLRGVLVVHDVAQQRGGLRHGDTGSVVEGSIGPGVCREKISRVIGEDLVGRESKLRWGCEALEGCRRAGRVLSRIGRN